MKSAKTFVFECISLIKRPIQLNSPYLIKFWEWSGFREKRLLDYLHLLFLPIIVSGGVLYVQTQFNERQQELINIRYMQDNRIAIDHYQQEMLLKYFDQMEKLLLEKNLRKSKQGSEVRSIARARTLSILRVLDEEHKGQLLIFLAEAGLINRNQAVVDLRGAYLSYANLHGANLSSVALSDTNLFHANLIGADLSNANLSGTNLLCTYLNSANIQRANLKKLTGLNHTKWLSPSIEQIKAANNWQQAIYDTDFCKQLLGLSPETPISIGDIHGAEEVCQYSKKFRNESDIPSNFSN